MTSKKTSAKKIIVLYKDVFDGYRVVESEYRYLLERGKIEDGKWFWKTTCMDDMRSVILAKWGRAVSQDAKYRANDDSWHLQNTLKERGYLVVPDYEKNEWIKKSDMIQTAAEA